MGDDGGQATQGRQAFPLCGLPLEARDRLGQAVERAGQHARVLVIPTGPVGERDLPREVAADRHLAHVVGDFRQRSRDGARHPVAEGDGQQHGDDGQGKEERLDGV